MWSYRNSNIILRAEVRTQEWILCNIQQTGCIFCFVFSVKYEECFKSKITLLREQAPFGGSA